ncbi:9bad8591-60f0-48ac-b62c-9d858c158f63 [Thermothielavioides terrestris]|uniref:9bad8591-60f0-48ac-b62c-9d858c158f63 n=1 Tax=Thermothielavioides terrestris TaxID=2587410 RepID=A0A446BPD1_9PEZI|nr:9bad8591-60f0-48ac-b62c-9d858c158f63 [Thermothielavioides terrestris]
MDPKRPVDGLRVLVIGAGSAGLLMGQVLKKAGIDVAVFEQDESPTARPQDWSFGVYWAQDRIQECLTPELNALIDTVQTDPSYRHHEASVLPIYNGVTGELLRALPAPHAIRLRRRPWLQLLRTGLDVRYGKRLASITTTDDGVSAAFEDGTTEHGTLLIGAEGAHSVTRAWLFRSSPADGALQRVPISAFAALTTLPAPTALALRAMPSTWFIAIDPRGVFTFAALHDCAPADPAQWTFMVLLTWPADEPDEQAALARDSDRLLDKMRAMAEPLAFPFDAMVRGIPRGTKSWYTDQMNYWLTKPWDGRGGRVTLAGDAAHALTFHRGQGLGNAITDAAELQTHLRAMKAHTREELTRAVAKYEREVWQRGRDVVAQNRENTLALHDWAQVTRKH